MFARGSRIAGRHARDDRSRRGPSRERRSQAEDVGVASADGEPDGVPQGPAGTADATGEGELAGPYDLADAPAGERRLDLGSLQIPSVPGVEVRVQANQQGTVQQVYLLQGESVLQLGVFAAPRIEPLWDEVREEIRRQLFDDGVAAEETPGDYGTELRARVRTKQGLKDLRFVGVDGPRWMVRAVFQGPAAIDPASAEPLTECLRGLVVDRGSDPRPVKEPLPLRLSDELAGQLPGRGTPAAAEPADGAGANPTATAHDAAAAGGDAGAPAGTTGAAGSATGGAQVNGAGPRRRPSPRPRRG